MKNNVLLLTIFSLMVSFGFASSVLAADVPLTIIDARTSVEYDEAHLEGAKNIDVLQDSFEKAVSELPREGAYKVYCRSGKRSARAEAIMKSLGFKNVENVGSLQEAAKKLNKKCESKNLKVAC